MIGQIGVVLPWSKETAVEVSVEFESFCEAEKMFNTGVGASLVSQICRQYSETLCRKMVRPPDYKK